ncbi:kinetochore Spc7 family protein [Streptomyces scabiei]|uniref:phage tail protein n=1 Tax=Streptomyces scabiei TaxID=1930 RepID=UPI0029A608B8|nr:phage tail protein [Streptomyces scabiei]MDX3126017.1 phage tail protein [Streptomyces scabiei]MDX3203068.1 phage tail protein [Streptomyces scabiei]MDX3223093.1 phage tail protein [Streptomyces scabiei]
MSDYLAPVVVELEGRDAQLRATLMAAKAEVRKWAADVGKMNASVGVKLDIAPGEAQKLKDRVGRIKPSVGVKLGIAAGEADKLKTRAGQIKASVGVKLGVEPGEADKLKARVGRVKPSVGVKLGVAQGEHQKLKDRVGRIRPTVDARLGVALGEPQKLKDRVGRIKPTVGVKLNVAPGEADKLKDRVGRVKASVGVKLGIATGEIQKLQERIGRIKATVLVGLRLDPAAVTATRTRLNTITADRTVTIRTRLIGGGPSGGGGRGRMGGALTGLLMLSPAVIPVAAHLTAAAASVAASVGAATVAVGAFGIAVKSQLSALGDAADAQKKYQKAVDEYGASSRQAAKAQAEQSRVLAKMPPATRQAAAAYLNLKRTYKDWSDELSTFTMKPVEQGLAVVEAILPRLKPLVKGTSTELERLTTFLGGGVNSSAFDGLMARFTTFANGALKTGVDYVIHFTRALSEGRIPEPIKAFMEYAEQNGPAVEETLSSIGGAISTLVEGAADAGPGMLTLVNAAAKLVASFPPELVSILLQTALALKAVSLAGAAAAAIGGALTRIRAQIAAVGTTSAAAGGGVAGLRAAFLSLGTAARASVVAAGVIALGLAVAKLSELGQKAPPQMDQLTSSVRDFGTTGKTAGEAARVFGKDMGDLAHAFDTFTDNKALTFFDDLSSGFGLFGDGTIAESKKMIDSFDESLAGLVKSGNGDVAKAALQNFREEAKKAGYDLGDLDKRLDGYNTAVGDAAFEQRFAAESMGLFGQQALATKQTLDAQKVSADGLRQSLQALNDVQRGALGGQIGFEAAMDAATKAAKENGRVLSMKNGQLDLGTQKARDSAQALSDLAAKTDEAAASARENGASWSTVNGIYDQGRDKLIAVAQQMGLSGEQAKTLADQILKIPDKNARVSMDAADAVSSLDSFIAAVKKAPGAKSVTLKTLSADAEKILESFGYKVTHLDNGSVTVSAKTGQAITNIGAVQTARDNLSDKAITITTNKVTVLSTVVSGTSSSLADALRKQAKNARKAHGGLVGRAAGGPAQYFGEGGPISGPGTPTSDSIVAMFASGAMARVSDTEYVVQASAVRKYGLPLLNALNSGQLKLPGFARGGVTKKERDARKDMAGQLRLSHFGKKAGYDYTSFEKALGKPGDIKSLVSSLNGLRGQIKASFHGKAESSLLKQLNTAGKSLIKYDKQLTKVNSSLEKAKDKLDDLKSSAKQLKESVTSAIMRDNSVITQAPQAGFALTSQDVLNSMSAQLSKTQEFTAQLETLKKRGLSAELLEQIAAAGVEGGSATAAALVGASDATLKQLNKMQGQMKSAAKSAGAAVSDAMYGAGIRSAEGLIKGLKARKKAIEKIMMGIAKGMEKALRAALGIKSPSVVMAKLGDFIALGLAMGVRRSARHAATAARTMAMSVQRNAALAAGTMPATAAAARAMAMSVRQDAALTAGTTPALTTTLPSLRADAAPVVHHYYEPHITVEGHVLTERKLRDVVEEQFLRMGGRNSTTYSPYKR